MFTIRDYAEEDWRAICAVYDRARPDELRGGCDPRAFVPLADDPEARDVHDSRKLVACAGGTVVGFAGVDGACVTWLYVDPAHRRRGVGRRLLRCALHHAGEGAWSVVLRDNAPARRLYASEGFRVTRTFRGEHAGCPCACVCVERGWPALFGPREGDTD